MICKTQINQTSEYKEAVEVEVVHVQFYMIRICLTRVKVSEKLIYF